MAQGDIVIFDQFFEDLGLKIHNLETDTFKVGLTDGTTVPATTTSDPRWGAAGSTDFSAEECTPGGNYSAGGATIANNTWALSGGLLVFDADDPATWSQSASNPTDATYGIIYNNTATGKQAVGYIDLGGAYDMTTGDLEITFGANGIARLNQA